MPKPIISVEKKRVNKLKEIICGRLALVTVIMQTMNCIEEVMMKSKSMQP